MVGAEMLAATRAELWCGDLEHDDPSTLSACDVELASSRQASSTRPPDATEHTFDEDDRGEGPSK